MPVCASYRERRSLPLPTVWRVGASGDFNTTTFEPCDEQPLGHSARSQRGPLQPASHAHLLGAVQVPCEPHPAGGKHAAFSH